jgi:threonine/homoserine/homoserine lactone efflux protein
LTLVTQILTKFEPHIQDLETIIMDYLLIGIGLAFASVVQPGPFQAFLLTQSLQNGWRKTIPLVFAPLITDGPIIVLVLIALTKVPPFVLQLLQCAGGFLLLYLAYGAYKTWKTFDLNKQQSISSQQNVFKAVLVNFFNPAPYLGWSLVMGPILIKGLNEAPSSGIALLVGFYSTMIMTSIGMVILFAAARNLGPKVNKISIGISSIALGMFGVYQLWSGIISSHFLKI